MLFCRLLIFLINFFKKKSFGNTIWVSTSLDPNLFASVISRRQLMRAHYNENKKRYDSELPYQRPDLIEMMKIEIDFTTSTNVHTSFYISVRECLDWWRNGVKANTNCNYSVSLLSQCHKLPIIRIFDNLKLNLQYLWLRNYEIRLYLYFIFISQVSIFNFTEHGWFSSYFELFQT